MDWRNFDEDRKSFGTVLKKWKKKNCVFIFRKITGCNCFSKVSVHFEKMPNSSKKLMQTYSEICIFYEIQYMDLQEQSVGGPLEMLGKSLKTVLYEVRFIVNLYSFSLLLCPQAKTFLPQVIHSPNPRQSNFQNSSPPSHLKFSPRLLSLPLQAERNYTFPQAAFFPKFAYSNSRKGWKKL